MIDLNKVYSFGNDADKRGILHLQPANENIDDIALFFGEADKNEAVKFIHLQGKTACDVISCSFAYIVLVSRKLHNLLEDNKITGWDSYPIEAYGKGKIKLEGYHGFSVTGKCGPILDEKSKRTLTPPRVPGAPSYYAHVGLYFDPNTWDGSDIFCPEGTYQTFVTERVKQTIEQASITNATFSKITEMENYNFFHEYVY